MKVVSSGPAYKDSVDALNNEFRDDSSNTIIVLGACYYSQCYYALKGIKFPDFHRKYDKVVVFNQEQLHIKNNTLTTYYKEWLRQADEVWDYDETNFDLLYEYNNNIKLHLLKPYKDWSIYTPPIGKDIDILFYGRMNDRRSYLLSELSKKYRVCFLTNEWQELDYYIIRSKILLNIHYYEDSALQEQARMIRWIGSPCRIISEKSVKNYLGVEEYTYEELLKL